MTWVSPSCSTMVCSWFNDQDTSDVVVLLENDQKLYCHRVVLRSWSPVWAAALTDKTESSLDMSGHDAATVKLCLKYCYNSAFKLTDDNLTHVHLFAYQYNLKDLKRSCEREITEKISVTNCMSLYCYLLKHSFPSLPKALKSVTDFACNEFTSAVHSSGFLTLDEEALCHLLAEPIRATEDDVLDACQRWLGASPNPQVSMRVLKLVRFPLLSAKRLIELRSSPWFQPELEPRYDFAMRWALIDRVEEPADQLALRARLEMENKLDNHLTPRPPFLRVRSQILDEGMKLTLATMIGRNCVGKLLIDSKRGNETTKFGEAVEDEAGPFVVIIESRVGHVFGAYVEDTFEEDGDWIEGSPNNFLFSLKNIPPQQVVKLTRTASDNACVYTGLEAGLIMGDVSHALAVFGQRSTADDPAFELAPGYESVGVKTLHGEFGSFSPSFVEVFELAEAVEETKKRKTEQSASQKKRKT